MARINQHRIILSRESTLDPKFEVARKDFTVPATWRVTALDVCNLASILDLAFLGQELTTLDASSHCVEAIQSAFEQLFGSDTNEFGITCDNFLSAVYIPYTDVIAYADSEYLRGASCFETNHAVAGTDYVCTKEYKKRRKKVIVTVAKEFCNANGDTVTLKTTTDGRVKERTLGIGKVFDLAAKGLAKQLCERAAAHRAHDGKRWTYRIDMECVASGIVIRK